MILFLTLNLVLHKHLVIYNFELSFKFYTEYKENIFILYFFKYCYALINLMNQRHIFVRSCNFLAFYKLF